MAISDEQILQAAADVIAERGYAGATTKQIAARAGMNEVTLFRRFGNKKNLMRSMIQHEVARLGQLDLDYSGDLEADLTKIAFAYQELVLRRGHVIRMFLSELPKQPELLDVVQGPQEQMRRFAFIIARYQAEGKLRHESPLMALVSLVGPMFLIGMFGFIEPALTQTLIDPPQLVQNFLDGRRMDAK